MRVSQGERQRQQPPHVPTDSQALICPFLYVMKAIQLDIDKKRSDSNINALHSSILSHTVSFIYRRNGITLTHSHTHLDTKAKYTPHGQPHTETKTS